MPATRPIGLSEPAGPLSTVGLEAMASGSAPSRDQRATAEVHLTTVSDPVGDRDLQLALHGAYSVHYAQLPGVDESLEWDPNLIALRAEIEHRFRDDLRYARPQPEATTRRAS